MYFGQRLASAVLFGATRKSRRPRDPRLPGRSYFISSQIYDAPVNNPAATLTPRRGTERLTVCAPRAS